MAQFHIRKAISADKEPVVNLWQMLMAYHRSLDSRFVVDPEGRRKYLSHVHEMIRSGSSQILVAENVENGEIVAYLMGEIQSRPPSALPGIYGFVSDIFVMEEWRSQGVGKALFSQMKLWFASKKATAVELYVADANPAASQFWATMGLTPFLILMHLDL